MRARLARLPRSTKLALLAGALGFAWTFLVAAYAGISAISKPSAEDQEVYGIPGDSAYGDLALVWRRLKGWPTASGKGDKKPCWPGGDAIWLDQEPLVRGTGPKNGVTVTYWVSDTRDSEVFLGRYAVDLWYHGQPSTGAGGLVTAIQRGDNTRFIERIAPPKSGPPGWRVIMPGQCAFGDVRPLDDKGTVGRFLIDLPARAKLRIHSGPGIDGKWVPLEDRLLFEGKDVPHVPIENAMKNSYYYRTGEAGRYAVVVRRTDAPEEHEAGHGRWTRFSLLVTWGGGGMFGCSAPTYDPNCFGEKSDE